MFNGWVRRKKKKKVTVLILGYSDVPFTFQIIVKRLNPSSFNKNLFHFKAYSLSVLKKPDMDTEYTVFSMTNRLKMSV